MPKIARNMQGRFVSETVKGGVVTREAQNGNLVEVRTDRSTSRVSAQSSQVLADVAERRRDALKRLADR
jgi:hypothetical protein